MPIVVSLEMMPDRSIGSSRTAIQKSIFIALLFAAAFSLPYLFPVSPSISRSYVAGFSNQAAVLILLFGIALFAFFTHGEIAKPGERDSRLPVSMLLASLGLTLSVCLLRLYVSRDGSLGGETYYFVNRQQMLAAGLAPYRQFEFVYGPLLLYPSFWFTKIFHLTALHGYIAVWCLGWLIGVAMIWMVVRAIDIPIPPRSLLFGFLVLAQLVWTNYGGLNYTPLRAYAAAFCIVVIHTLWTRSKSPWLMSLSSVAAVALTIMCSTEQAVGVTVGLLAYMFLLALSRDLKFPWPALAVSICGVLTCFAVASRAGLLITTRSFASGGYSYPLLPSFSICIGLFAYVAAGCLLYRSLRLRNLQSVTIPLILAGCAMLPAALGRSDILHITAATPAFVVGAASLYGMPSLGRWWLALAFIGLVLVPFGVARSDRFWKHVIPGYTPSTTVARSPDSARRDTNQYYVSPSNLTMASLPCDRTYFSPSFLPVPTEPMRPSCLDTGYYQGLVDVITPGTIEDKVSELRQRPSEPLLLENTSLEDQFPLELSDMESLHRESGSLWVPPARNPPLTYTPISDYIRSHYVPGPLLVDGRLQIWYPSSMAPH
jgi:hypothetical protein